MFEAKVYTKKVDYTMHLTDCPTIQDAAMVVDTLIEYKGTFISAEGYSVQIRDASIVEAVIISPVSKIDLKDQTFPWEVKR